MEKKLKKSYYLDHRRPRPSQKGRKIARSYDLTQNL